MSGLSSLYLGLLLSISSVLSSYKKSIIYHDHGQPPLHTVPCISQFELGAFLRLRFCFLDNVPNEGFGCPFID